MFLLKMMPNLKLKKWQTTTHKKCNHRSLFKKNIMPKKIIIKRAKRLLNKQTNKKTKKQKTKNQKRVEINQLSKYIVIPLLVSILFHFKIETSPIKR